MTIKQQEVMDMINGDMRLAREHTCISRVAVKSIQSFGKVDCEITHSLAIGVLLGALEDIGMGNVSDAYRERVETLGWVTA